MSKTEDAVLKIAESIAEAAGVSIYDVEYKKEGSNWFLRVYIEGKEGTTIDDCEKVSRPLSAALDDADIIDAAYYLEVSSPGIERVLSKDGHFKGALGEKVCVKLFAALDGKKQLTGTLKAFENGILTLSEDGTEKEYNIKKSEASLVKTLFDFGQE